MIKYKYQIVPRFGLILSLKQQCNKILNKNHEDNTSTSNNILLQTLELNNTKKIALANKYSNMDRSCDYLLNHNVSKTADVSTNKIKQYTFPRPGSTKKVSFQGILKYKLINIDKLGLIHQLRIVVKRKAIDSTLNYISFVYVNKALEKDIDPMKETLVYKEAIKILCKN